MNRTAGTAHNEEHATLADADHCQRALFGDEGFAAVVLFKFDDDGLTLHHTANFDHLSKTISWMPDCLANDKRHRSAGRGVRR